MPSHTCNYLWMACCLSTCLCSLLRKLACRARPPPPSSPAPCPRWAGCTPRRTGPPPPPAPGPAATPRRWGGTRPPACGLEGGQGRAGSGEDRPLTQTQAREKGQWQVCEGGGRRGFWPWLPLILLWPSACSAPSHVVPCSSSYSTAGGAAGSSTEESVPWPFLRFSFSAGHRTEQGRREMRDGRRRAG